MKQTPVAGATDIPDGESRRYNVDGTPVAVFRAGDAFYACKDVCPHRGGPIGEGDFDGRIVTCPWHGWQFDVTTGQNVILPAARLEMLPVAVEGDQVQVGLPD